MELRPPRGLFIGLTTLDLIYHAPSAPGSNEKCVAQSMTFSAGGPATNAAIAFSALGGQATLISVVGQHPLTQMIQADISRYQIHHLDLMPHRIEPPTVSSIVVSTDTGDRAVISKNAQSYQILETQDWADLMISRLNEIDVVLFDGHQMALSQDIAAAAQKRGIPTIFDGGSWKVGSEHLLPHLSHIICSAAFRPPACGNESEVLQYLRLQSPNANLAITQGSAPILIDTPALQTTYPCPSIPVVDTLGAGDFFHGAFAFWIAQRSFEASIQAASQIASLSCQFPGTREWLSKLSNADY